MKNILFIVTTFFLFSCGARKVEKARSEENSKTELIDKTETKISGFKNAKETTTLKIDDKTEFIIKEINYEPIDITKISSITTPDGKKYDFINSRITQKETIRKNNSKTDVSKNLQSKINNKLVDRKNIATKSSSKKETEQIKIERSEVSVWYFVIPIGLILIAFYVWKNRIKIFS